MPRKSRRKPKRKNQQTVVSENASIQTTKKPRRFSRKRISKTAKAALEQQVMDCLAANHPSPLRKKQIIKQTGMNPDFWNTVQASLAGANRIVNVGMQKSGARWGITDSELPNVRDRRRPRLDTHHPRGQKREVVVDTAENTIEEVVVHTPDRNRVHNISQATAFIANIEGPCWVSWNSKGRTLSLTRNEKGQVHLHDKAQDGD
jgi:hypothetical protein